jgi:hypothetical protein
LCLGILSSLPLHAFQLKRCMPSSWPTRATCPAHLILFKCILVSSTNYNTSLYEIPCSPVFWSQLWSEHTTYIKDKVIPVYAMKAYGGRGCLPPPILNLTTKRR